MSRAEFERVVESALAEVPAELRQLLDNIVVTVEEEPSDDELLDAGLDPETETLFGLYRGVPYGARGWEYGGELPDQILIFRRPLLEACESRRELLEEIRLTVIHEVGHYFGLDEEQLP